MGCDLPTEAQWEYACRAGTNSEYNNGGDKEEDLKQVGRYKGNQSDGKGGSNGPVPVGSYLPNAWMLYDMHGNAIEWCLDYGGVFAMKQSCVIRVFVKTMVIWDGSVNIMVSAL